MPFDLSEAMLAGCEARLGLRFPEAWRVGMRADNGGAVLDRVREDEWELLPVLDTTDRRGLLRTFDHLERENTAFRIRSGFPPNAVAFATNACGDAPVFVGVAPGDLGSDVFLWSREDRSMTRVADGFDALREVLTRR